MPRTIPARSHAARIRSAPAAVSVSGFSQNTCLPAAIADSACASCWLCGVAMITASTARSASTASNGAAERDAVPPREVAEAFGRDVDPVRHAHVAALGEAGDDLLAPPAEPDHRRLEHAGTARAGQPLTISAHFGHARLSAGMSYGW